LLFKSFFNTVDRICVYDILNAYSLFLSEISMWMIEHGSNTNIFMFVGVLGVNGIIVSFRWVYDTQRSADYPVFYM